MKRLLTATALLIAYATNANASPIPPDSVSWNYDWKPGTPAVTADGNPSAGVTFTDQATKAATGSSDIVATNLRVFSTATAGAPDALVSNGAYSLTLKLSTNPDGSGPYSGSLTFTGKLGGTFSGESANVTNAYDNLGTQSINLGGYTFTVTLYPFTPPGPPGQTNAGSISAHVEVSSIRPSELPEPGTLLLSAFGATFFGGAAWRKRRKARMAQA
jgi:hypothetical protein